MSGLPVKRRSGFENDTPTYNPLIVGTPADSGTVVATASNKGLTTTNPFSFVSIVVYEHGPFAGARDRNPVGRFESSDTAHQLFERVVS
jgi:hypothetical protein